MQASQLQHTPYVLRLLVAMAMPLRSLKMPTTVFSGTDCRSAPALVAPLLALARPTRTYGQRMSERLLSSQMMHLYYS